MKRNPQDSTRRNDEASKKRDEALLERIKKLEGKFKVFKDDHEERLKYVEKQIAKGQKYVRD